MFSQLLLVALLIPFPLHATTVEKSPKITAMTTHIMDQALVQDVVRVGDRLFLAGEHGHIGWSDDGGKTWQQATVPTIQTINAICFVTKELGWAAGYDGNILHTTDSGKTWALQLDGLAFNIEHAKAKVAAVEKQLAEDKQELEAKQKQLDQVQADLDKAKGTKSRNSSKGEAAAEKLSAEIDELQSKMDELDFQKRDATKTLETENAPWPLMDVWFADINNGFAVGAFNQFLVTTDGGTTWTDASGRLDNPEGYHLNAVSGAGQTVFIVGEAGLLFRSTDGGAKWEKLASPDQGSFFGLDVTAQDKSPQVKVMMVGLRGAAYLSLDSGNHWDKIEHNLGGNLNGIYTDPSGLVLIVGNDGALLRSTDGGKTVEPFTLSTRTTMGSVAVAPNGDYVLGGVDGIKLMKPAELKAEKK